MGENTSVGPIYHIVEEGSESPIIAAREISGFFVEPNRGRSEEILIFGSAEESMRLEKDFSDVELRVVNFQGGAIGSYYIGRVGLRSEFDDDGSIEGSGFIADFYGLTCPYPAAGTIWRQWFTGPPLIKGGWLEYPAESHDSWLHVVQNSWFETGRAAKRYGSREVCVIDGRQILNEGGFYCALGESVNGPAGYFGSTLDGLSDCLASSRSAGAPFKLLWEYFSDSREKMGSALTASIIDVLKDHEVQVIIK